MKSEELVLTDFNLYFITFPRQLFVGFFHVIFPTEENAVGIRQWLVSVTPTDGTLL